MISEIAANLLTRNTNGEFLDQRTPKWYSIKHIKISASEIPSILECNIHQSSHDLLLKKIKPHDENAVITQPSLLWGIKFESVAEKFYEFLTNETLHKIGLVIHPLYDCIGASPDGLILTSTYTII